MYVVFNDKNWNYAGCVLIEFYEQIKYSLRDCTPYIPFYTLPIERQKTWIIRYDYTKGSVVIHCNEIEVVNVLLSSECTQPKWREIWEKETTKIKFTITDSASDRYCFSSNPGKQNGEFWEVLPIHDVFL